MRRWHSNPAPHRLLNHGDRGEDVRRWQHAMNVRGARRGRRTTTADGIAGPDSFRLWRLVRWDIGLPREHPPTTAAQAFTRWPWTRSPAARRRARRRRAAAAPRIITSAQLGLGFQWVFGGKGPVFRGAGHYTAGGRSANAGELVEEARRDHAFHMGKRWGGLAYEAMVADDGTILLGNPVGRKSAGVGGANTGLVNVCCPGTTGDRMTDAQIASVEWLQENWHTAEVPAAHRLPRPAPQLSWRGHKEYPNNPTGCPGDMLGQYHAIWR